MFADWFQAALGKYCVHLLADYITSAAAPPLHAASSHSAAIPMAATQQADAMEALTGPAATALRQGALALYGACSPAEVRKVSLAFIPMMSMCRCRLTVRKQHLHW